MRKRIFLVPGKKWIFLCLALFNMACERDFNFGYEPEKDQFALEVSYNNKVDVLWVVDNSSSMLQHQKRLSSQLGSFLDTLDATKMDYHIGVITTSMGGQNPNGGRLFGEPKFISRKSANSRALIESRFVIGQDGSDNEKGLDSLAQTLDVDRMKFEYPGFLRDDSLFVIIFLTDENDHSAIATSQSVIEQIDKLKKPFADGSRSWVAHFIGVEEVSSACTTFNRYSDPGDSYLEIVKETGGISESICTGDLRSALVKMKRKIVQTLTDFYLDRVPRVETIKIYFNGKLIPQNENDGWSYFAEGNFIRFNGSAVPGAEDKISVDYIPLETKE